jgi:anthranilate phosphoribosyltransferase
MIGAYVLIIAKSGFEKQVLEKLRKYKEIKEAKIVYGEYDIIAKIHVAEVSKLNDFLLEKVRSLEIEKTSTLIVAA